MVYESIGAWLRAVCRVWAIFGGCLLVAVALVTVASIIGRAGIPLGLGPVPGDFELVEAGAAVAVFCFLPWCQLHRGHVTVDILVDRFPPRLKAALTALGDVTLLLVSVVIAWRLWLGLGEKIAYQETTFILQMPVWYGFALGMPGAALFALAALYSLWGSVLQTMGARAA
ncbi:MAG: TRAP transporter small permease [Pseudomonadota bacterium]